MPAITGTIVAGAVAAKKIFVTASKIITVYNEVRTVVGDIITAKNFLTNLREGQLQQAWGSTTNADSSVFNQRMQELDSDIQQMLRTLDEYTDLLQRSANEFQTTQQNVHGNASQLKSPTNR